MNNIIEYLNGEEATASVAEFMLSGLKVAQLKEIGKALHLNIHKKNKQELIERIIATTIIARQTGYLIRTGL